MADVDNGSDWAIALGVDPAFPEVKGRRKLAYRTFRRVTTDPALGIFELPSGEPACIDLGEYLNEELDPRALGSIEKDIERCCAFDEEIDSVVATVTLLDTYFRILIMISPADDAAPFPLVVSVDKVTARVLNDADLG